MVIERFQAFKEGSLCRQPKRAVVAAAHDRHTLEGVFWAREGGLCDPVLVGHREEIMDLCQQLGYVISPDSIIDGGDEEDCAQKAVDLVRRGAGDLLVKGLMQTGTLLRPVLSRTGGIRRGELLSHMAVLDVPAYHKLLFITDGGMNIAPDLEKKRGILQNALDLCRSLGYDRPKVAALCSVETENPAMPETIDAAALKAAGERGEFGPCYIEGPISFDLATDRQAAQVKGYQSPVAGDADILLVPSIAGGNMLGKALYGLAGGKMAGVVLGAQVPITVNSRGASAEEKYDSILLCCAMTQA